MTETTMYALFDKIVILYRSGHKLLAKLILERYSATVDDYTSGTNNFYRDYRHLKLTK